jgi:predicted nucleotidyltransferase
MNLVKIVEKYHLVLLFVFGSFDTERFNNNSDIDVGYIAKKTLNNEEEVNLLTELVFFFKRDLIDLVNMNSATPLLLFEAANKAKVLYEKDDSFLRFKIKAFARYTETKFLRDMRRDFLEKSI